MALLVLASQSPRRKQLLEWAEIKFEVIVEHKQEIYKNELSPSELSIDIAMQKALAVQHILPTRVILAADTIVVSGKDVIGKPRDKIHAIEILSRLSGSDHEVVTGVVLMSADKILSFSDVTYVSFHKLTTEQITYYVDKYKPYDKAGAYAIQEWIGVTGIQSIKGDFYNVMGLPISRVVKALKEFSPEILL